MDELVVLAVVHLDGVVRLTPGRDRVGVVEVAQLVALDAEVVGEGGTGPGPRGPRAARGPPAPPRAGSGRAWPSWRGPPPRRGGPWGGWHRHRAPGSGPGRH